MEKSTSATSSVLACGRKEGAPTARPRDVSRRDSYRSSASLSALSKIGVPPIQILTIYCYALCEDDARIWILAGLPQARARDSLSRRQRSTLNQCIGTSAFCDCAMSCEGFTGNATQRGRLHSRRFLPFTVPYWHLRKGRFGIERPKFLNSPSVYSADARQTDRHSCAVCMRIGKVEVFAYRNPKDTRKTGEEETGLEPDRRRRIVSPSLSPLS